MKDTQVRLTEIRNTVHAECGDNRRHQLDAVLQRRAQTDVARQLNLLDGSGLSDAVSFDLGRQANAAGRPHRRLVRALLFVRGLQRGMNALEIGTLKQKYLAKTDLECRQLLRAAFDNDPMWDSTDLGAFDFRVTFMDQRLITTSLSEHGDGICTGLALLWVNRILQNPGEDAWSRLHWAKKQKDVAVATQAKREAITREYDDEFGEQRSAAHDRVTKRHDPDGQLRQNREAIQQLAFNKRHAGRTGDAEGAKQIGRKIEAIEKASRRIEKTMAAEMKQLVAELDQHAIGHQIGQLLEANFLQLTHCTRRCDVGSPEQVAALSKEMDEKIARPAALLMSLTFMKGISPTRHMWAGYWSADAFRVFDPNAGEYYCPGTNPTTLFESLQAQYGLRGAAITDIQALSVRATA